MAKIIGSILDKYKGIQIEARVQVINSRGQFVHPTDAILKVGPGNPFFYCDGKFEVDVPYGNNQILVERGTEYIPAKYHVDVSSNKPR